jgi:hypothetical protein
LGFQVGEPGFDESQRLGLRPTNTLGHYSLTKAPTKATTARKEIVAHQYAIGRKRGA